jgi:hypothetical protein
VTNTVWPNGCLGEIWLGPFPDALLEDAIDVPLGLEARYEQTESISLAFLTAVQILPARQLAVLIWHVGRATAAGEGVECGVG